MSELDRSEGDHSVGDELYFFFLLLVPVKNDISLFSRYVASKMRVGICISVEATRCWLFRQLQPTAITCQLKFIDSDFFPAHNVIERNHHHYQSHHFSIARQDTSREKQVPTVWFLFRIYFYVFRLFLPRLDGRHYSALLHTQLFQFLVHLFVLILVVTRHAFPTTNYTYAWYLCIYATSVKWTEKNETKPWEWADDGKATKYSFSSSPLPLFTSFVRVLGSSNLTRILIRHLASEELKVEKKKVRLPIQYLENVLLHHFNIVIGLFDLVLKGRKALADFCAFNGYSRLLEHRRCSRWESGHFGITHFALMTRSNVSLDPKNEKKNDL